MSSTSTPWIARSRTRVWLASAAACGLVVAAFAIMVTQDRSPLDSFDRWGMRAEDWADGDPPLIRLLRGIELAFATIGMIVWTTLLAVVLVVRRRWRAAAFVVTVMTGTSLLTTAIKLAVGRARPEWQDPVDQLTSKSFPSGHASSSAALAGVLLILVWGLLSHGALRAALSSLVLVMWLVVCLDRVLLGRHFPTDVVAGSFLGVAVLLVSLVAFDPLSGRRPTPTDAEEAAESITRPPRGIGQDGWMKSQTIAVPTGGSETVLDITRQCENFVADRGDGLLHVFVPHATAGIAMIETGAGSPEDLLTALADLLPADDRWRHRHGSPGHGRSHVMPAIVPPYATVPVLDGRLALGTWQSICLVDLNVDNPDREVRLSFLAG